MQYGALKNKPKLVMSEELGREIPEGWKFDKLENVTEIYLGGTPSTKKPEYWGGTINWLNSGEVAQFPVVESELLITKTGMDNSATKLLPVNTTVVSITGNIRCSITAIKTCANQSVVGILETKAAHSSYLYQNVSDLIKRYVKISTGNCQQHINKKTIEESYILIPPENVLIDYYKLVDPMYEKIIKIGLENKKLSRIRNSLLPLLLNGQVSVR